MHVVLGLLKLYQYDGCDFFFSFHLKENGNQGCSENVSISVLQN